MEESELEFLKSKIGSKKIAFATPCYGGMIYEPYFNSFFRLTNLLNHIGVEHYLLTVTNESLITRARNLLVNMFLNTDADILMFIDADIEFNEYDIINMMLKEEPVVCGSYPMKGFTFENLLSNEFSSVEEIVYLINNNVVNLKIEDEDSIPVENRMIELLDGGTGFMMIQRDVIEKMIVEYPETEYIQEIDNKQIYALFDTMIDEGKRYLSEDYTFCRRWQKMGGRVMLDLDVVLNHMGTHKFEGKKIIDLGD